MTTASTLDLNREGGAIDIASSGATVKGTTVVNEVTTLVTLAGANHRWKLIATNIQVGASGSGCD